jgi:hypothetical protein
VRKKLAATFWFASNARIAFTPSPLPPASNVSATTLRLVGTRLTTRPARDGGSGVVGAEAGARVVDVVLVGAVEAVVDVGPLEAEVGVLLVVELVMVASVVGPTVGVCDEHPQAETSISTRQRTPRRWPREPMSPLSPFSSRPIYCPPNFRHLGAR